MITLEEYFASIAALRQEELSAEDEETLGNAFNLGRELHGEQLRASGESYFDGHCIPVSRHVASLQMGADMIAAALLHDTIEDTSVTYEELAKHCGKDIADMVDAVSKLSKVRFHGNERHVESLRKFFVAIAQDVRVVVIKLCDRWHNLETLEYLRPDKQLRIARESIFIHAQLASRLNMGKLASTLRDLAFPYAYPDQYRKTMKTIGASRDKATIAAETIHSELSELGSKVLHYKPDVDVRVKGLYSTYEKLVRKDWNIHLIHDLVALRVIVRNVDDCYRMLGAIHGHWHTLPGRLKDYISMPKPNGYKSIHTVIMDKSGVNAEVQVRTDEMHLVNEYGITAHHTYKLRQTGSQIRHTFHWIDQINSLKEVDLSPEEYLQQLQADFFSTRIFALTPAGDVIDLPQGATALDFAYAVHSDIGNQAYRAIINDVPRPLHTPIASESVVEIVTSSSAKPRQNWLKSVVTSNAKAQIKKALLAEK